MAEGSGAGFVASRVVTGGVGTPTAWDPETGPVVAWIERSMGPGARVVQVEAMPVSATAKHLVTVGFRDGSRRRLLLRRYHDAERLTRDPWYVPAHEASTLRLLSASEVPAPRLYAADLEAAVCDVPALLESWIPGVPGWRPDDVQAYVARAAEVLVKVHAVNMPPGTDLPRYAPYSRRGLALPPFTTRPGLWERVGDVLDAPWPAHRETFIHRDYHPGNVLWDGNQVTGVIDWATAAWGPPGIDLARMRMNLAAHLGTDVADQFLVAYIAAGGDRSARDPFWDLLDAANVLPDLSSPAPLGDGDIARFEEYVEDLLAECRGPGL